MKKKSLIALMLAATLTAGVATMSACSGSKDVDIDDNGSYEVKIGDNLIVALHEKLVTIHKGSVSSLYFHIGYGKLSSINKLKAKCGEEVYANDIVIYPNGVPSEDKYDQLCEYCFKYQD